ncbi:MAG: PTS N-acetylmuramic acid transporter subunit IIBC [Cardiobacteriaceae bacterium]|nr:PTS N-acetylmuramic acid transporter subunit IIBC [Cardiobacteriaceae bacterium]
MMTREQLSELLNLLGGSENIADIEHCITRLRLRVHDDSRVQLEEIKALSGVMAVVVAGGQYQVVLGVGKSAPAAEIFRELVVEGSGQSALTVRNNPVLNRDDLTVIADVEKARLKAKHSTQFHQFLSTFASIFTPLIPAFIAVGLLLGIASLLEQMLGAEKLASSAFWSNVVLYMKVFHKSLMSFLALMIGFNATRAFGGTGALGAVLAGFFVMTYSPEAKGVFSGLSTFFGIEIDPRGGIIGALIAAIVCAKVEKGIRRYVKPSLDLLVTPALTLLVMGILTFLVIMPVGSWLFVGMSWLFGNLSGNPLGTAILAGLFLVAVTMGIHQGFVPVYMALVESQGFNSLFPVLAMAGAGQIGATLALYVRAQKDSMLRQHIKGAIVPAFLGVGEPLIYGVTLPRIKPFITACLGGACGGFVIGLFAYLGYPVGLNSVFGPSGLLAIPLMTSQEGSLLGIQVYLTGMVSAWIGGFVTTWLWGSKNVDLS